MSQSVSIDPEDIVNRLAQKLAQCETNLVVAESTRDAALKQVAELRASIAKTNEKPTSTAGVPFPDDDGQQVIHPDGVDSPRGVTLG